MRPGMAITLILSVLLSGCGADNSSEIGAGDVAPAWDATTFDGVPVSFPQVLNGKPTVFVVWATWCNYCKAFMPELRKIQNEYGVDKINVLTINAKEDGDGDPGRYIADLDFPMIAVRDGDAIAAAYDVEYVPGLMVIGADGVIAYRREWTELPAGQTVAMLWGLQVRENLKRLLPHQ